MRFKCPLHFIIVLLFIHRPDSLDIEYCLLYFLLVGLILLIFDIEHLAHLPPNHLALIPHLPTLVYPLPILLDPLPLNLFINEVCELLFILLPLSREVHLVIVEEVGHVLGFGLEIAVQD